MNLFQGRVVEQKNAARSLLGALRNAVDWEQREKSGRFRTAAESIGRQQYLAEKTYVIPMADCFQKPTGPVILSLEGVVGPAPGSRQRLPCPVINAEKSTDEIQAICRILKKHLRRESFEKADLISLAESLNSPIESIQAGGSAGRNQVTVSAHPTRFAAEELLRYLAYFAGDSRLLKHEALALCPGCDSMFVKAKSDQEYCNSKCYRNKWQDRKQKEGHFARKMRESRQHKKEDKALELYEAGVAKRTEPKSIRKALILRFNKPARPVSWAVLERWIDAAKKRREKIAGTQKGKLQSKRGPR